MNDRLLAILGGSPQLVDPPFTWPLRDRSVQDSVQAALKDGAWGAYEGQYTDQLELRLCETFGQDLVQLCCSGTIAVELALRGAGVKAGDEVLLAGYDFPGNFRAIEAIGAIPVLLDVVDQGWTIDSACIGAAMSPSTKAIVVSHLHGQLADIDGVRDAIGASANPAVVLVEDACQVPGARRGADPVGSFGDVTALSFGGSKLLTAGRGGAILTSQPDILQRARIFSQRGNDAFPLSQLQAAALVPQLESLPDLTARRAEAATKLGLQLTDLGLGGCLSLAPNGCLPAFYKFPLLVTGEANVPAIDWVVDALQAEGIPAGSGFRGFNKRSARRCRKPVPLTNCITAAESTILIHHPVLLADDETIAKVAETIAQVMRHRPD